jgi:hypothetical protein|tara:strand:+ start:7613 stop:7744 length:132 start_codon:yes stop_codon:yes gene_type:complete
MAKKISRVTKAAKLDKRTTSGRAAAGKSTSNKTMAKKIMKGKK